MCTHITVDIKLKTLHILSLSYETQKVSCKLSFPNKELFLQACSTKLWESSTCIVPSPGECETLICNFPFSTHQNALKKPVIQSICSVYVYMHVHRYTVEPF